MHSEKLLIAEHLLNQTYPALKEPKLLLSVIQNIKAAIEDAITLKLESARAAGDIPPYTTTFNGKITAFRMHLAKEHNINPVDFMMIGEIQEILVEHENSPVEFRRKGALIIANEDYQLQTLTPEKTKTFIQRTKSFLSRL